MNTQEDTNTNVRDNTGDTILMNKLGRLSKEYIAGKIHPLSECLGGNIFHENKLYMLPEMGKAEFTRLASSRSSRILMDDNDHVIGLRELEKIEQGFFYNVQEGNMTKRFIRDDLVEPTGCSVKLTLYKNDIVLSSKKFGDKTDFMNEDLSGPADTSFMYPDNEQEADDEEFSNSFGDSSVGKEKGLKSGTRGEITELTRKSSDKMKFVLRNSLCDFPCFITLTYPRYFPRSGKVCKKHLNLFLTHLRKDYKGIKYFWFMEFQERGAPHFHIFLSCVIPGKTYISPLWYRIVNSGDPKHLNAGTNVTVLKNPSDVVKYATSYAKKATQKMTPEDFYFVGRFWGSSRKLCEPIVELSDLSIRQIQELWSCHYDSLNLSSTLRHDRFNGYIWEGKRFAAQLVSNYYESHFRPMIAELAMLSTETEVDKKKRKANTEGESESVSFEENPLQFLVNLKRRVKAAGSVWKDLTSSEFEAELKKGTVASKLLDSKYKHSLSVAYEGLTSESIAASEITREDWAHWLAFLQTRMELSWVSVHKPLSKAEAHTHITLCKDGRIFKRKYRPDFRAEAKESNSLELTVKN